MTTVDVRQYCEESLLLQRFFEFTIMMIDEHQCRSDSMIRVKKPRALSESQIWQ